MKMLGENVALDRASQSTFTKAVKNIQRLIKKGSVKVSDEAVKSGTNRENWGKPSDRGVVYLSHIPHGFYEDEMLSYFNQFGRITGVKLIRSRKTGNSRGFAFIEFLDKEVAKIAAETMNNYLMYDRLIKAEYVPPEKQKPMAFSQGLHTKRVTPETCDKAQNRKNFIEMKNSRIRAKREEKTVTQYKKRLAHLKKKLEKDDITFNFEPVNEPQFPAKETKKREEKKKGTLLDESQEGDYGKDGAPIISLDLSDPEIEFNAPPGIMTRPLKKTMVEHEQGLRTPKKSPKILSKIARSNTLGKKTKSGFKVSDSMMVGSAEKKSKSKLNLKMSKISKLKSGFTVTPSKDELTVARK